MNHQDLLPLLMMGKGVWQYFQSQKIYEYLSDSDWDYVRVRTEFQVCMDVCQHPSECLPTSMKPQYV